MAATAISVRFRKTRKFHLFSFSSTSTEPPNNAEDPNTNTAATSPSQSQHSFSSYFSDVKSSLKQQQSPLQPSPSKPFSLCSAPLPTHNPSKVASLEEIRKNLSEFRRRSAVPLPTGDNSSSSPSPPPPPSPRSSQHISFQELYKRNMISKGEESNTTESGKLSFDAIRQSLRQLRKNQNGGENKGGETIPRPKFVDGLLGSANSVPVFGGTDSLPASVFGKEREKKPAGESATMKTAFVKMYTYGELGEKLRMLRPEEAREKAEKWFSLGELNERLMKLRDIEQESEWRIGGVFKDLRESLVTLQMSDEEKAKKSVTHRLDVLGQLGVTPNFMLSPPKENLVEKYFHPDNMSSSEKMKIELKKVRDEFKMSESDCGSARVQVAQLTTKIKHLSTALHKKDKHSRKGLQAMVQQRKKLLKYLRRTDWDSYCLVLSKLGLRDNPDYKN